MQRASASDEHETPVPSGSELETLPPRPIPPSATLPGLTGTFGRYKIEALLGQGGMGAVYLARDTQLDRLVALKTPRFENDKDGELLNRFYREAKAAGTVNHPHVCPVYGVEEINGRPFLAMAYIEGRPLSDYIHPDKFRPERQVLVVIRKLALALQEAHDRGIVHRDLKPANVMIDKRGEPIVMDFGLARPVEVEQDSKITTTGVVIGSPAYMAPEQIDDDFGKIGHHTDQYALGVILYELLTGNVPFRGSIAAIYGKIVSRPPISLRRIRPELDPRIDALALRMMAKRPSERLPSMRAVAEAVQEILAKPASPPVAKPAATTRRLRSPQQIAALVAQASDLVEDHKYDKAVDLLETVLPEERTPELTRVLEEALELSDEVTYLTARLLDAWTRGSSQDEIPSVRRLLELVPDHSLGLKILEKLKQESSHWWAGISLARPLGLSALSSWLQWSISLLLLFAATFGTMVFYYDLANLSLRNTTLAKLGQPLEKEKQPPPKISEPAKQPVALLEPAVPLKPPEPLPILQPTGAITGASLVWSLGGDEATFGKRGRLLDYSSDGKFLAVFDGDKPPQIVNAATGKIIRQIPQGPNTWVRFIPGSSEVLLLHHQGLSPLDALDVLSGKKREAVPIKIRKAYNLGNFTPDHKLLFLEGRWDYFSVYDWKAKTLSEEQIIFPNYRFDPEKSHLAVNRDGSIVAFAHGPTTEVILWDRINKKQLARFQAHQPNKWLTSIHFSPDDQFLATTSHEQNVKIWNASNGSLVKEYPETDWVQSGTYSPDGKYFASASHFEGTKIRELSSGRIVASIPRHQVHMSDLAWSSDGKFIATVSSEHSGRSDERSKGFAELKLWKLEFGSSKSSPSINSPSINSPAELQAPFSPAAAQQAQQQWSDYLKQPVELPNSVGMKMRLIPPGRFRMGSLESKEEAVKFAAATGVKDPPPDSFNEEYPAHDVRILPFALSTTEVTFAQFRKFVEATGHKTQAEKDGKGKGFFSDKEGPKVSKEYSFRNIGIPLDNNFPAVNVSWDDAQAFCKWLSRSENKRYRLPYEAEWEYACRAGTITRFVSGDDPQSLVRVANVGDASARSRFPQWNYSLSGNDGYPRLAPVAQFSANPFGLYDMHGNVWEWCQDVYQKDYYRSAPDLTTPQGPMQGDDRVLRGGSHSSLPRSIRSSERGFNEITHKDTNLGFRVALEIPLP